MNPISIRPFIGAKNFHLSRAFYTTLGFDETILSPQLSVFHYHGISFYLQNAYVKDWVDNTMVFVEVENVELFWNKLSALDLLNKYPDARIEPIKTLDWGSEFFVHDPSGILWHFGSFKK